MFSVMLVLAISCYLEKKKKIPGVIAELIAKKESFLQKEKLSNFCHVCGNKVESGISICPSCGSNIAS